MASKVVQYQDLTGLRFRNQLHWPMIRRPLVGVVRSVDELIALLAEVT